MNNGVILDWATMAVSICNTILLLWLGTTVLLNAENRTWGVYLASGGLLLGGAFFVSHSAVLGLGVERLTVRNMTFWWTVALIPSTMLPFTWYVIILWFSGYWGSNSPVRRRHRVSFYGIAGMMFAGLVALLGSIVLIAGEPGEFLALRRLVGLSVFGVPLLAIGYALYVLGCFGLSVDVLRQPAYTHRMMGTRARRRAHPWLVGTAVSLLIVSLLVTGIMLWIAPFAFNQSFIDIYLSVQNPFEVLDLIVSSVILMATFMLGQAIVSYEVFTGKTLPRGGLLRHWQRVVMLAVSYGFIIGAVRALGVRTIYGLLLATILMAIFFALVSWQSYVERDRFMDSLRPFILSQHLYDQLITASSPQEVDIYEPFRVLCDDVLEARLAYLTALGPMSAFAGPPLIFPRGQNTEVPALNALLPKFESPNLFPIPIPAQSYGGAAWAISLWSARGLIGVLLLGEKRGGGVYTQEEMEIARAIGERLIDSLASAIMSQRLMGLQRERLTQTQVIDQQTRRVLHDDILPTIQTALITLSHEDVTPGTVETVSILTDAHRQISDLLHDMPTTSVPDVVRLGLLPALKRTVENDLSHAFARVNWNITKKAATQLAHLPTLTAEVLFYAAREVVRNAARYGTSDQLERSFVLNISAYFDNDLVIQIEDNGVGINGSPKSRSAGQGLALHSTMMAVIGGEIIIESEVGQFTRVKLTLPEERLLAVT